MKFQSSRLKLIVCLTFAASLLVTTSPISLQVQPQGPRLLHPLANHIKDGDFMQSQFMGHHHLYFQHQGPRFWHGRPMDIGAGRFFSQHWVMNSRACQLIQHSDPSTRLRSANYNNVEISQQVENLPKGNYMLFFMWTISHHGQGIKVQINMENKNLTDIQFDNLFVASIPVSNLKLTNLKILFQGTYLERQRNPKVCVGQISLVRSDQPTFPVYKVDGFYIRRSLSNSNRRIMFAYNLIKNGDFKQDYRHHQDHDGLRKHGFDHWFSDTFSHKRKATDFNHHFKQNMVAATLNPLGPSTLYQNVNLHPGKYKLIFDLCRNFQAHQSEVKMLVVLNTVAVYEPVVNYHHVKQHEVFFQIQQPTQFRIEFASAYAYHCNQGPIIANVALVVYKDRWPPFQTNYLETQTEIPEPYGRRISTSSIEEDGAKGGF